MLNEGSDQCPCCDYFTLNRRGSYDICPVCYWEDDGLGLADMDVLSAPNHISLRTARENFRLCGAADLAAVSLVASNEDREGLRREIRT